MIIVEPKINARDLHAVPMSKPLAAVAKLQGVKNRLVLDMRSLHVHLAGGGFDDALAQLVLSRSLLSGTVEGSV